MDEIKFTPAPGGWLHADWGTGHAWVRLGKDRQGRLTKIRELHVVDPTPDMVRGVPLTRIHAAVTMRGAGLIQVALAVALDQEPPTLETLSRRPAKSGAKLDRRYRLERPKGRRLTDDFYRDVAHAYQSAIAFGMQPRKAIVTDTGAADATVAGWVGEARRRGYLPEGRPGKVTA
jgi:hypothetical protein